MQMFSALTYQGQGQGGERMRQGENTPKQPKKNVTNLCHLLAVRENGAQHKVCVCGEGSADVVSNGR